MDLVKALDQATGTIPVNCIFLKGECLAWGLKGNRLLTLCHQGPVSKQTLSLDNPETLKWQRDLLQMR